MPQFEIKEEESKEIGKVTFDKESDYVVIKLKSDATGKTHLVHKLHADKLVSKGAAEEVKKAKLEKRTAEDSQMVVNPEK